MAQRKIHWADHLEQIVGDVGILYPDEKTACWYDKHDFEMISMCDSFLIKSFKNRGFKDFKDAEVHFNQNGHSLRGLEAMEDDLTKHQVKNILQNRRILEKPNSKKAIKKAKKRAEKAHEMGLYDEENSMCFTGRFQKPKDKRSSQKGKRLSIELRVSTRGRSSIVKDSGSFAVSEFSSMHEQIEEEKQAM